MFGSKTYHICSVHEETSRSFLPVLPPIASNFQKLKRFCKQLILVTEENPQSLIFYKNLNRVEEERRKQIDMGSWIIHPFSTLRLYYEMWMTVGFFFIFIILPFDSAYAVLLPNYDSSFYDDICKVISWFDILMNFRTGFVYSSEEILMKQSKIARTYILTPRFVADVLSSLPDVCDLEESNSYYCDIAFYFGLLKIFRLQTFLDYLERSLNYFNVGGYNGLFINVVFVSTIMTHYFSCLMLCCVLAYHSIHEKKTIAYTQYLQEQRNQTDYTPVELTIKTYIRHFYEVSSYLMGIDIPVKLNTTWIDNLASILIMFTGKLMFTFLTVILVDIFKNNFYLETKYNAMMGQIDSFMTANQFPLNLQKKIRRFYSYKYRDRYLNEARIEQFLSEKLKKEIRFHDCRKLVQCVHIFEQFPQKILEDMLNLLKLELYMENDCIIKAGTVGDCMYFLSLGTVAVLSPTGKEICHLSDGDYFGELCLLVPKAKRSASVIALENCEVYRMDRKLFKKCIEGHPVLYKEMQLVAKQRFDETKEIESTIIQIKRLPSLK